jgi:exodeoxyribonuclease VII small subunit
MATNASGEFERALARLEEIVRELEGGSVELERSVALFREGRDLAKRCEELLKAAQEAVDATASDARPAVAPAAAPGQLPF